MGPIWARGGAPEAWDFSIAICFALGFLGASFLLDMFVYQVISLEILQSCQRIFPIFLLMIVALQLLCKGAVSVVIDEARQSKIAKSSESMWKLTYYIVVQLWFILIMQQESWSIIKMEYFEGWPNQGLKLPLKLFYMCQCGFYIYSIVALLTWETRRKGFSIMMSHHIITSLLIGYSYLTRFFRIGTIILALHDTSEMFLEAAKVFKYSEKEVGGSVCFGLFAVSWLLLRLMFFPLFIIRASSYHTLKEVDGFPRDFYYAFNTMLLTLLVFHAYWSKLLCATIMEQMSNRGKLGEDIRSDSVDGGD